jgi:hypothetical protein
MAKRRTVLPRSVALRLVDSAAGAAQRNAEVDPSSVRYNVNASVAVGPCTLLHARSRFNRESRCLLSARSKSRARNQQYLEFTSDLALMCAIWITFYPVARLKRAEAWWAHSARGIVILFAFLLAQRFFR